MIQVACFHQPEGPLPIDMAKSQGTALALLKAGPFAADLIRFAPGEGVAMHAHPGSHILAVVSGAGELRTPEETVALRPGLCYLAPAHAPHSVYASPHDWLTLISIADDHRGAGDQDRLELT